MSKFIYGVGINDADYNITKNINGKRVCCPYYVRWHGILRRCYSIKFHDHSPCYSGCSISKEWIYFSKFKSWMETQNWKNNELDKDLLIPGNKIYAPDRCIFIPHNVNSFLTHSKRIKSKYPLGCVCNKQSKKFVSRIEIDNQKIILGYYPSAMEAHKSWQIKKVEHINLIIESQDNKKIINALTRISKDILNDYHNNLETKLTIK
jgi:hypothetical protein